MNFMDLPNANHFVILIKFSLLKILFLLETEPQDTQAVTSD